MYKYGKKWASRKYFWFVRPLKYAGDFLGCLVIKNPLCKKKKKESTMRCRGADSIPSGWTKVLHVGPLSWCITTRVSVHYCKRSAWFNKGPECSAETQHSRINEYIFSKGPLKKKTYDDALKWNMTTNVFKSSISFPF